MGTGITLSKEHAPRVESMPGFEGRYAREDGYNLGFESFGESSWCRACCTQRRRLQDLLNPATLHALVRVRSRWLIGRAFAIVVSPLGNTSVHRRKPWAHRQANDGPPNPSLQRTRP